MSLAPSTITMSVTMIPLRNKKYIELAIGTRAKRELTKPRRVLFPTSGPVSVTPVGDVTFTGVAADFFVNKIFERLNIR